MVSRSSRNQGYTARSSRRSISPTRRRSQSLSKSSSRNKRQTNPARRIRSNSKESSVRHSRVAQRQGTDTMTNASKGSRPSVTVSQTTIDKSAASKNQYQTKSPASKASSAPLGRERGRRAVASNNQNDARPKSASRATMTRRSKSPANKTPKSFLGINKGRSKSAPRIGRRQVAQSKNGSSTRTTRKVEPPANSAPKAIVNSSARMENIKTTRARSNPVISRTNQGPGQNTPSFAKDQWKMAYDSDRKEPYYYNRITRETTWTRPEDIDFFNQQKNQVLTDESEKNDDSGPNNPCSPLCWNPGEANTTKSFGGCSTASSWTDGFTSNDDSDDNDFPTIIKPAWKQVTDPTSKQKYYCHRLTNQTRWVKPDGYDEERRAYKAAIARQRCKKAFDYSAEGNPSVPYNIATMAKHDDERSMFGAPIQQIYDSAVSTMTSFVSTSTTTPQKQEDGKPSPPEPLSSPNDTATKTKAVDLSKRKHSFSRIRSTGQRSGLLNKKKEKEKQPKISIQHEQVTTPSSPAGNDGLMQTFKQNIAMSKDTSKMAAAQSLKKLSERQRAGSLSKRQRSQQSSKEGISNKEKIQIHHEQTAGNAPESELAAVVSVAPSRAPTKTIKNSPESSLIETRQEMQDNNKSRSSSVSARQAPEAVTSKSILSGGSKSISTFSRIKRLQCSKKAEDAEAFGYHLTPTSRKSTSATSKKKAFTFSRNRSTGQRAQPSASKSIANSLPQTKPVEAKKETKAIKNQSTSEAHQKKVSYDSESFDKTDPTTPGSTTLKSMKPSDFPFLPDQETDLTSVVKRPNSADANNNQKSATGRRRNVRTDKSILSSQTSFTDAAESNMATTSFLSGLACADESTMEVFRDGEDKYYVGGHSSAGSYTRAGDNSVLGAIPWISEEMPCSPTQAGAAVAARTPSVEDDDYTNNGTWESSTAWSERYYL